MDAESRASRRKSAARANIELAAVEIGLEHGIGGVTVEMVCERALISHRTFYNYFPSKEAALLGDGPGLPDEEKLAEFRAGTGRDVVTALAELLAAGAVRKVQADPTLFAARCRLTMREPELFDRGLGRSSEHIQQLTVLVLDRFEQAGRTPRDDPALRAEASMVVALAGAVMREALWEYVRSDGDVSEILARSVEMARRIVSGSPENSCS